MIHADLTTTYVTPTVISQHLPSIWTQSHESETLGPDSEKRNEATRLVIDHWSSRPTLILLASQGGDFPYQHIALTPGRKVKTRYHYVGRIPAREIPEAD